ncbi:MAG: vanadium-dependent haloperoxidase, partial [Acidobacteria bacterium]|nr:vanadium-dependent haloperoxidase [Acidobacteriota bacterium]
MRIPTLTTFSLLGMFFLPVKVAGAIVANPVLDWNRTVLNLIRVEGTAPTTASRNLALVHAAIFDALMGIERTHTPFVVRQLGPSPVSVEASTAAAAFHVLTNLFRTENSEALISMKYGTAVAGMADGDAKQNGIAWGKVVAEMVLASRRDDGASVKAAFAPGTFPAQWRPTISFGGQVRGALAPHWGQVTPFCVESVSAYRPPPPPTLGSREYAAEVEEVRRMGGLFSRVRTQEQTEIAHFWAYGPHTATPPGHWNEIATSLADAQSLTVHESARLFALLNMAVAEAGIMSWDCKYAYNYWRPITAIHGADHDGNEATKADVTWAPLLPTPPFPEYTSGHSTFSGAAAAVLAGFFGTDKIRFTVGSDEMPGTMRRFERFSQAAEESGLSRIYGGIHFQSANRQGLASGRAVGKQVVETMFQPITEKQ